MSTTGIHHELLGNEEAERSCTYAALNHHVAEMAESSVIDAHITLHPKPKENRKIEGVVMIRRRNAPHEGRERATLQFSYNNKTGGVELFWGHYDLAAGEAHEDFAERIKRS